MKSSVPSSGGKGFTPTKVYPDAMMFILDDAWCTVCPSDVQCFEKLGWREASTSMRVAMGLESVLTSLHGALQVQFSNAGGLCGVAMHAYSPTSLRIGRV